MILQPPLHTAARGGHEAIVRKLLSRSDIDDDAVCRLRFILILTVMQKTALDVCYVKSWNDY